MAKAFVVLLSVCVLCAVTGTARAQRTPLDVNESYYELGPTYFEGPLAFFSDFGGPMKASGLRIYERNGLGGKMVATSVVAIILAAGSSDKEYLGSSHHSGPGYEYRVDYYRQKSSEELAAEAAARGAAIDATAKAEYQMDVQIYMPNEDLETTVEGFSWSLWPLSFGNKYRFELGFLWTRMKDAGAELEDGSVPIDEVTLMPNPRRLYQNLGSPLRLIGRVGVFGWWDIQWDLNWLALADDKPFISHESPLRFNFTLNPIYGRVFARGGLVFGDSTYKELGYTVEAGLRF